MASAKGIELQGSLFQPDKWARARVAMGVDGRIGSVPDGRYLRTIREAMEMRDRGLDIRGCVAVPPLEVIAMAQEGLNDGKSISELCDAFLDNELVTDSMDIDVSVTLPSTERMCPSGVEFMTLIPKQHSGRTLHFYPEGDRKTRPVVIDWDTIFVIPNFRDCWHVPSATPSYQKYFAAVIAPEAHFVGTAARLFSLLESIEANLVEAVAILPPWRTAAEWKRFLSAPCTRHMMQRSKRRETIVWGGH
eukprot:TRINITY_DN28088_c0_g1_i1.p1 TRINITY_DN28088_c0_g1~~TRINITY_DN28088_c0_g1_i1.p1  ORF type:complete len:290 (+),score=81.14 TRINITY_DN28088_c0_g1_i1:127-870(+)